MQPPHVYIPADGLARREGPTAEVAGEWPPAKRNLGRAAASGGQKARWPREKFFGRSARVPPWNRPTWALDRVGSRAGPAWPKSTPRPASAKLSLARGEDPPWLAAEDESTLSPAQWATRAGAAVLEPFGARYFRGYERLSVLTSHGIVPAATCTKPMALGQLRRPSRVAGRGMDGPPFRAITGSYPQRRSGRASPQAAS